MTRARHSLSPAVAALAAVTLAFVAAVGLSGCGGTSSASMSYFPEPTPGRSLSPVPGARVWAVGAPELVIESTDGGATWAAKHQRAGAWHTYLNDLVFANSRRAWAVGEHVIVTTDDGGETWTSRRWPRAFHLWDVACGDGRHAWAVGTYNANENLTPLKGRVLILATNDGGLTWEEQHTRGHAELSDVVFTDARHGWAVGYDGAAMHPVIVATADGGGHWRAQDPGVWPKSTSLSGVAFADSLHGWAVGRTVNSKGIILSTSDGGAHWVTELSAVDHALHRVASTDARHVWAVGDSGLIMASTDGGGIWQDQSTEQPFSVSKVSFADNATGWALIGRSHLLATRDGGKTWTVVSPVPQTPELRLWLGGVVCLPN